MFIKLFVAIILCLATVTTALVDTVENDIEASCKMNRVLSKIGKIKQLPKGEPMQTSDPFLFCVYHKDNYPAGGPKMEVPGVTGNGADFNADAEFRMYHGDIIPGFPQHPHRGFETITATIEGIIDHSDSLSNAGRYGQGDLQWMTAGKGIVHGENFPLINEKENNPTRFFQIWLNLPARNKMVDPDFVMHWASEVKKVESEGAHVTVWAGRHRDTVALAPTTNSWAADPANEVGIMHITLDNTGDFVELESAEGGKDITRTLYIVEGRKANVNGKEVKRMDHAVAAMIETTGGGVTRVEAVDGRIELLLLQGRPIKEPTVSYGPFVMNTKEEIHQAFADYRKTSFGGWPWDEDAVIFPRDKPRFALLNGVETYPSDA